MKVAILVLAFGLLTIHAQTQTQSPTPTTTSTPTPTPTGTSTPTSTSTSTPSGTTPAPTARPPVVGPTPAPTATPPVSGPTPAPTARPPANGPRRAPGPGSPSGGGGGGGGAGGGGSSPSSTPNAAALPAGQNAPTDADILYFAYNLEVFEANFYLCSTTGTGLPSQYLGGGPNPTGCQTASLSSQIGTFAAELALEETAHVALLYNALKAAGVNPVAPLVDISAATWNTALGLALNTNPSPAFSPYANDLFFLHAPFIFEDLGTSAYLGALNSISNSSYRLTAAQIGAAEAYHSSLDRTLLYQNLTATTPYGLTVANITSAIVSLENTVAGAPQIKYNLFNNQGSEIANVDSNGLVPAASAQQVLRVVTLGAKSGSGGGFFPNNLNGNVKN